MRLENKVALVTGGGKGIGKAIATKLAQEGAKVIVNDVEFAFAANTVERLKLMGCESLAVKGDVSQWQEVAEMFEQIEYRFGGADIVINNAGKRSDVPVHKISEEDWDSIIAIQLKGSFYCIQAAQRHMVEQSYGKIINLSSPVPASLGNQGQLSYASANSAIQGFTKALALELGRYNINVNSVAPDFIDTEMSRSTARREGMYVDDYRRFAIAQVPLRRMGRPEDVANIVAFLVSDESSFISGQVIYVRGGP